MYSNKQASKEREMAQTDIADYLADLDEDYQEDACDGILKAVVPVMAASATLDQVQWYIKKLWDEARENQETK